MKYVLCFLVLAACGGQTTSNLDSGTTDGASSEAAASCKSSKDCPTGQICGFDEASGCSDNSGECFATGVLCNSFQPGCACSGDTINIVCSGLPAGYATAPLAHTGTCDALDAGGPD